MNQIFSGCSSLKELNLSNFNTNNIKYMNSMFKGCSSLKDKLKMKIRIQNKNINKEAFI